MWTRVRRTFEGKIDCILLDHAGNVKRHGFPTMEPEVDLDGEIKGDRHEMESKICKQCFAVYRGIACPLCGKQAPPEVKKEFVETNDKLVEIKVTSKSPPEQWLEYLEQQRKKTNRKNGWQYWKLLEKFKFEEVENLLPEFFKQRYKSKKLFEETDNPFGSSPFRGFGGE